MHYKCLVKCETECSIFNYENCWDKLMLLFILIKTIDEIGHLEFPNQNCKIVYGHIQFKKDNLLVWNIYVQIYVNLESCHSKCIRICSYGHRL